MIAQAVAALDCRAPTTERLVVSAVFGCTYHGGPAHRAASSRDFFKAITTPPRLPAQPTEAGRVAGWCAAPCAPLTGLCCVHLTDISAARVEVSRKLQSFNYTPTWMANNPSTFEAIVSTAVTRRRPMRGIAAQAAGTTTFDSRADLPLLTIPVMVLHGDEDALLPVTCGRDIARLVPNW
jgi:pimeloyl-ACP methyl ester carboxylesterase